MARKKFLHREMTKKEKVIGTMLVILFSVFLYLSSPIARMRSITIHAGSDVLSDDVKSVTKLVENELFFMPLFFSNVLTDQLKQQFPKIDTVQYDIDAQNNVTVTVSEYEVIATVTVNDTVKVLLSNGKLLDNYVNKYIGSVTDIVWSDSDALLMLAHFFLDDYL